MLQKMNHILKMVIFITGARRDSFEDDLEDINFDLAMPSFFAGMYIYSYPEVYRITERDAIT